MNFSITQPQSRAVWLVALVALGLSVFAALSAVATNATECAGAAGTCNGGTDLSLDGSLTVNDDGDAVDIRFEGDANANLFDTDGSSDQVAIGVDAATQSELFSVNGGSTFWDELNVGSTPVPGTAGQVMESQGAGASPEWVTLNLPSTFVNKTGDTAIANDATLSDDPHLQFTALANTEYAIIGNLIFTESSAVTGHYAQLRINVPTGTSEFVTTTFDTGSTLGAPVWAGSEVLTAYCDAGGTAERACSITGTALVAGSGGTVAIEWAQITSQSTTLTLKAGSWIAYKELS